jgi:hypothetical protein
MALNRGEPSGRARHERPMLRGDGAMSTMDGSNPRFRIEERFDDDGVVRLALFGELDLSVSDEFRHRLGELRRGGLDVRLDLSELEFIDSRSSSWLSLNHGATAGDWRSARTYSAPSDRVIDLAGVGSYIWPAAG